jgi:hypothetical protein
MSFRRPRPFSAPSGPIAPPNAPQAILVTSSGVQSDLVVHDRLYVITILQVRFL